MKQLKLFNLKYYLLPLLFLTPQSGIGYVLQIFVILIAFISKYQSNYFRLKINISFFIKILILMIYCLAILYQITIVQEPIYYKNILKGFNIIFLIFLFPFNYKLYTNKLVFWIILITIGLSQIAYIFNINFFINLIDNYYYLEGYSNSSETSSVLSSSESIMDLRFGGLYRNPNQCSRAITFLSGFYLVSRFKSFTSKMDVLFLFFAMIFILITGSRTGFVVQLIMIISFFYIKHYKTFKYYLIISLPFLIYFIINSNYNFSSIRILNFNELFSSSSSLSSFSLKLEFLKEYIYYKADNFHFFQLLFGTSQIDASHFLGFNENYRIKNFDSEIGYIINGFGLIGLFLIAFFYFIQIKKIPRQFNYILTLLLWMITSSVLTNLRFSLILTVLISYIFIIKRERIYA